MPSRDVDEARFRAANHRHLTVLEVMEGVGDVASFHIRLRGWRLWCMNCGLKGTYVFDDRIAAMRFADDLRSMSEPQCEHRGALPGDPS